MTDDRLKRLATENSPAIANYLRRRLYPLSDSDLDDLVEETLLVTWRRIDDVPKEAELAWMIGAARNVLRNARRARHRRSIHESELRPTPDSPSAESLFLANASVRDAMTALRQVDREILMMRFWDGLDVDAIAVVLAISVSAAHVRLSRAQARFRASFASSAIT